MRRLLRINPIPALRRSSLTNFQSSIVSGRRLFTSSGHDPVISSETEVKKENTSAAPHSAGPAERLVYIGTFGKRLKSLRRVSLFSSVCSIIGFPIAIAFGGSSVMPMAGQIAMASTIIVTSLASTIFLQTVCYTYVTSVIELPSPDKDRRIRVTRLNLFGNDVVTDLKLSETERIGESVHPFASFRAQGTNYYVYQGGVEDPELRRSLTISN